MAKDCARRFQKWHLLFGPTAKKQSTWWKEGVSLKRRPNKLLNNNLRVVLILAVCWLFQIQTQVRRTMKRLIIKRVIVIMMIMNNITITLTNIKRILIFAKELGSTSEWISCWFIWNPYVFNMLLVYRNYIVSSVTTWGVTRMFKACFFTSVKTNILGFLDDQSYSC